MGFGQDRIVDRFAREWQRRVPERRGRRRRRRRWRAVADRDHGDRDLALRIEVEQAFERAVDESGDGLRRHVERRCGGEQVCEQRARIPEHVPVCARAVLPRVPPEGAGEDEQHRRLRDVGLRARRVDKRRAMVAVAQPAEREVVWSEVPDAPLDAVERRGHDVGVDVVERARARGGPIVDRPSRIAASTQDARAEVEEVSERLRVDRLRRRGRGRQRRQRRPLRAGQVGRQRNAVEIGIDLERQGLIVPVERMRIGAHAGEGVLRACMVIAEGDRHHCAIGKTPIAGHRVVAARARARFPEKSTSVPQAGLLAPTIVSPRSREGGCLARSPPRSS
jgi:hypothetical protein